MAYRKIIPAAQSRELPRADFTCFDKRPVNYYRSMLIDYTETNNHQIDEAALGQYVHTAVAAERARLIELHVREQQQQFEAGLAKGREEAAAETQRATELLAEYGRLLQTEKHETTMRSEKAAIDLAFMLAEKIIGGEIALKPERVADVVKNALQQVLDCRQITLRVNAQDLEFLQNAQADLEQIVGTGRLEFQQDPDMPRGGCMINTERGTIDARLRSQLETLRVTLDDAAESAER